MGRLVLENVSKNFACPGGAAAITAIDRFSLIVPDGKLLVLLGPSGCGKTTLLRLIAGLETPSTGQILLDSQSFNRSPPQRRPIGMAFQYPALLPQLTVRHNVALGPKLRGDSNAEAQERVRRIAQLLGITDILLAGSSSVFLWRERWLPSRQSSCSMSHWRTSTR
jgi:ABC-type sugar transport system ATPase subunit